MDFLIKHGYMVLFVTVLAEQIGLPLPAAPFLIAAGALAGFERLNLGQTLAVAAAASLLSDAFWFYLGKREGRSILRFLSRISLNPDACLSKTRTIYSHYGPRTLLVSKFVPGLNEIAPLMAGMFKLAPWRFAVLDSTAAVLWAGAYIGLGWIFREQFEILETLLERIGVWMGVVCAAGLAAYIAVKYLQRQRIYRALRIARITPEELKRRMDGGEILTIIDLRNAIDRNHGRIPQPIRLAGYNPSVAFDPQTEVVLYCSLSNEFETARASLRLRRLGVDRVRPLEGGFSLWRDLGFPVDGAIECRGPRFHVAG